jgi:hypothetical protein
MSKKRRRATTQAPLGRSGVAAVAGIPVSPTQAPERVDETQRCREHLRERFPSLYSRVIVLEKLVTLQQARGGEFEPKYVFVHMPDYILNIRRVGEIDLQAAVVAFEVHEHNDIVPGIIWVPLDHIWWVGTTDEPCGAEQLGLRAKTVHGLPPDSAYRQARLKLSGLAPRV